MPTAARGATLILLGALLAQAPLMAQTSQTANAYQRRDPEFSGPRTVVSPPSNVAATPTDPAPAWARRMKRAQSVNQGVAAATHAVRSGDGAGSGSSVDLSEGGH